MKEFTIEELVSLRKFLIRSHARVDYEDMGFDESKMTEIINTANNLVTIKLQDYGIS